MKKVLGYSLIIATVVAGFVFQHRHMKSKYNELVDFLPQALYSTYIVSCISNVTDFAAAAKIRVPEAGVQQICLNRGGEFIENYLRESK